MLKSPKAAGDAELADQQEIIARRLLPIRHAQPLRLLPAAFGMNSISVSTGQVIVSARPHHDKL
jgi:hypothetical protein